MNRLSDYDFRKFHDILHLTHVHVFLIAQVEKKLRALEHLRIFRFSQVFTKMSNFKVLSQLFENTVLLNICRKSHLR